MSSKGKKVQKPAVTILAAACASTAGLLVAQVPAQAGPLTPLPLAPTCAMWKLDGGSLDLDLANGVTISVPWDTRLGTSAGTGSARLTNGPADWYGPVSGGIVRPSSLDINITWTNNNSRDFGSGPPNTQLPEPFPTNHITGSINTDSGTASGDTVNEKGVSTHWTSRTHFSCADSPAQAPPPGPAEKPVFCTADGRTLPPGSDCSKTPAPKAPEEKPPTDKVVMIIGRAGLNIKVSVTSTSPIPGHCLYTATEVNNLWPPVTEEFDIPKLGKHEFQKPAPLPGQNWHVVLSCRGDFNGQQVEFGHQEQNFP